MTAHVSRSRLAGTWLVWNDRGQHVELSEVEMADVLAQVENLRERRANVEG